jgi:hypothetical protein
MKTTLYGLSFGLMLARAKMMLWPVDSESDCRWIEGDDYLDRIHRGEEIYCNAPVRRLGESYCAAHRARAYIDRRSPRRETERRGDLTREAA